MGDVKLTREGLRAAILRLEDDEFEHLAVAHDVLQVIRATRALLAATEPASDEEADAAITIEVRDGRHVLHHPLSAYRAAEARVRRLAFGEEGK
jgi:hypothetical protein